MNPHFIISQLKNNLSVFKSLLESVNKETYSFKPTPSTWSLLEITCHLLDEEREDFKQRVFWTLEKSGESPPAIDPSGWVESRHYLSQDYHMKVAEFLEERKKSIDYLENLKDPNWQGSYLHPKLGKLSAAHFLVNWLAHDYIHIRQINRTKYLYLRTMTSNNCDYAGNW